MKREADVTTENMRSVTIGEIDKLLRDDPRFRGVDLVDKHGKKRGGWYNKCQVLCEAILAGRQDIAVMAATLWRRQGGLESSGQEHSDGSAREVSSSHATGSQAHEADDAF